MTTLPYDFAAGLYGQAKNLGRLVWAARHGGTAVMNSLRQQEASNHGYDIIMQLFRIVMYHRGKVNTPTWVVKRRAPDVPRQVRTGQTLRPSVRRAPRWYG